MGRDRDPIEQRRERTGDRYDITTWEPRSRVDRLAVGLSERLRASAGGLVVVLAVALVVTQFALGGLVALTEPGLDVLTTLSVVPALLLAATVWSLAPTDRPPATSLAITFLLAALFASYAAVLNTVLFRGFRLVPVVGLFVLFFLVVGPLEESVKWLAVRVHAYRSGTLESVLDGMVYGAVAGLGFATVENSLSISRAFLAVAQPGVAAVTTTQFLAVLETAAERSVVGPGHVLYSSISGYYLGLARVNADQYGPIAVKGVLLAALAHATYNTVVTYASLTGLAFVAFVVGYDGAVAYYLYRKVRRYRRAFDVPRDEAVSEP
jgi:RsiW-degrading membrane proteinase PrsW (M82 family)